MPRRTVGPLYVPASIAVPKGTLAAAPLVTPIVVEAGQLEAIDLQIPNGHSGVTGIRFTLAGQQILPWSNTVSWIIGDDLRETFLCDVEVDTQLAAVAFNVGNYAHTFLCRFRIRQLDGNTAPTPLRLIENNQLGA